MKHVFISSFYILLAILGSQAQSFVTPLNNNLVPPAPQSWVPAARQIPQPEHLTGAVNFNIPIADIKAGEYSLPVSLNYNSNGIKVMDDPAPLGYGWILMPALRANRIVRGRPDEVCEFSSYQNSSDFAYKSLVSSRVSNDYLDSEHDIITFSLPSETVTRVIVHNSNGYNFVGPRNADFDVSTGGVKSLDSLIVTDAKGIKYIFAGIKETQTIDNSGFNPPASWPLKRILLPDGQKIDFTWSLTKHPSFSYPGGYSFMDEADLNSHALVFGSDQDNNDAVAGNFRPYSSVTDILTLKEINATGQKVTFNYQAINSRPYLKGIEIRNSRGVLVKSVALGYKNSAPLLETVNLSDEGNYNLEYENPLDFSTNSTLRKAQDWWGFYNGKNTNSTLFPALRLYRRNRMTDARLPFQINGADRSVDSTLMKTNILRKVVFPLGGICEFDLEPHKFNPIKVMADSALIPSADIPTFSYGGGVRVKAIRLYPDASSTNPLRITYDYSPATVRSVPSPGTFIDVVYSASNYSEDNYNVVLHRSVSINPFSNYNQGDMGETPIWYNEVVENYPEGAKKYIHSDCLSNHNEIYTEPGKRIMKSLNRIFDGGIKLVALLTYKNNGNNRALSEEETWSYSPAMGSEVTGNAACYRKIIQVGTNSAFCPDLDNGTHVSASNTGSDFSLDEVYGVLTYSINPYFTRLVNHFVKVYPDQGNPITNYETFQYVDHSTRVALLTTQDSRQRTKTTQVTYPSPSLQRIQGHPMTTTSGPLGCPLKETVTVGNAIINYIAEYSQYATGAFALKKIITRFGSNTTGGLNGMEYSYNNQGRIVESKDADGIVSSFLWGYDNMYPVWLVPGVSFSTVKNRIGTASANSSNAQSVSLRSYFTNATSFSYKPLVGVTSISHPTNFTESFSYNDQNRLSAQINNGTLVATYSYFLGADQENSIKVGTYIDNNQKVNSFTYYDGLGRQTQTLNEETEIRQYTEYDLMGRIKRTSVASANDPGLYDWTLYSYLPAPGGRLLSSTKPGQEWHTNNKSICTRIVSNSLSGTYSLPLLLVEENGVKYVTSNYAQGTLLIEEVTDEDGHIVCTFKDKDNRVLAIKEGVEGDFFTTYYIYDDYGRLRYILPPIAGTGTYADSHEKMQKYAFIFKYDDLGRCIMKKSPGCDPDYYKYSPSGRLVAEHSSKMEDGLWQLYFYDSQGREIITSLAQPTPAQLNSLSETLLVGSYSQNGQYAGYNFSSQLPCDIGDIQIVKYYDNYNCLNRSDIDFGFTAEHPQPVITSNSGIGHLTCQADFSDKEAKKARGGVYIYDIWERIEATYFKLESGPQFQQFSYNRKGDIKEQIESLDAGLMASFNRVLRNTYDSAGRISSSTIVENGATASIAYEYGTNGLVSKESYGNSAYRTYEYDEHGWITQSQMNVKNTSLILPQLSLSAQYYSETADPLSLDPVMVGTRFTEKYLYADATNPRYSGTPGAREFFSGGRYDYEFDSHDRLVAANYKPKKGANVNEDFSTSYSYNKANLPTNVVRHGVSTSLFNNTESFGTIDDLSYTYDGLLPTSISDSEFISLVYAGTGFDAASKNYTWNSAGQMTAEGGTQYSYDRRGLPASTTPTKVILTTYIYDGFGELLSANSYNALTKQTARTRYAAGRILMDELPYPDPINLSEKLVKYYSYFPGGYFDEEGAVHYLHRDIQGSVVMETDSVGAIARQINYYPYGEPWREPGGQPLTYQGKERTKATSSYDFGPRSYDAPILLWRQSDLNGSNQPAFAPHSYCGANPVKFIDPDGKDIVVLAGFMHLAMLIQNEDKKWQYYSVNGTNMYVPHTDIFLGGRKFNDVAVGGWETPQEFYRSEYFDRTGDAEDENSINYRFLLAYEISSTSEQDEVMRETFKNIADTSYDLLYNNCATTVESAMQKAGLYSFSSNLFEDRNNQNSKVTSISAKILIRILQTNFDIKKVMKYSIPLCAFFNIISDNPNGKWEVLDLYRLQKNL